MKPLPAASVIVTSYNDLDILETTLAALAAQSHRDFEVVIADDGSAQDYAPALRAWARRFMHGVQHVWHSDMGFRRARILNRAIHASRFDTLIFVDMDCLPHKRFVENHARFCGPGAGVTGRRTHVGRDAMPSPAQILERGLGFNPARLLWMRLTGRARVIEHGLVTPILYEAAYNAMLGSNHSVWRSDAMAVNGYNEEYVGYGWEDCDFELRLQLAGVRFRNLRNKVVQYHLMHPQRCEENSHNLELFERAKSERVMRSPLGLAEIQPGDFSVAKYGGATPCSDVWEQPGGPPPSVS
jgi:glycosyltransferase involved in cell wall biosynthesis